MMSDDGILLIIDDNESFLHAAGKELEDSFRSVYLMLASKYNDEKIIEDFQHINPDYLLLDLNLNTPTRSREILSALAGKRLLSDCIVRIISFGVSGKDYLTGNESAQISQEEQKFSVDETIIIEYQSISARVQGPLIRKPISAFSLKAALTDASVYQAPQEWEQLPLPLRVLDAKGSIAYANPAWRKNNMYKPDPVDFLEWMNEERVPSSEYYHGSNFDENSSGFYLHSFYLEKDGERFLGQIVESQRLEESDDNFEQAVDQIFKVMEKAGFPRGQCFVFYPLAQHYKSFESYVSMDKEGNQSVSVVVHLERVTGNHSRAVQKRCGSSNQASFVVPLRGQLLERMAAYQESKKTADKSELIYSVRQATDDETAQDADIRAWSTVLEQRRGSQNYIKSWLEIPIISKTEASPFYHGEAKYQVVALLRFNRNRSAADDGSNLYDSDVDVKEDDHVKPIKVLLKNQVKKLLKSLIKRSEERYRKRHSFVGACDQQLLEIGNLDKQKKKLIESMGLAAQADHALLLHRDLSSDEIILEVGWHNAANGTFPDFIKTLRIPLKNEFKHIDIVRSWMDEMPVYMQAMNEAEYIDDVINQAKSSSYALSEEKGRNVIAWASWMAENIKSALVYPIIVNRQCVGLIVLYYHKPWMILAKTMESVLELAHRAKWVLQSAYQEEERKIWLLSLAHEMLSDLNISQSAMLKIQNLVPDNAELKREVRYANLGLIASIDLAKNWTTLFGPNADKLDAEPFNPLQALQDTLEHYQDYFKDCIAQVAICSVDEKTWASSLSLLHARAFSRVIRVLVHNAVKHGRAYLDDVERYDETCQVNITCCIKDGFFILEIINPGVLSEQEIHETDSGVQRYSRRSDGAGIGLWIARQLVNRIGGQLKMKYNENNQIVVVLRWPLPTQTHG